MPAIFNAARSSLARATTDDLQSANPFRRAIRGSAGLPLVTTTISGQQRAASNRFVVRVGDGNGNAIDVAWRLSCIGHPICGQHCEVSSSTIWSGGAEKYGFSRKV
jgi:hypothetical protein